MRRINSFIFPALALMLGGCVSLNEVSDYASESARLASYKELTVHFKDTYTRESPYLYGGALALAQENDRKRQAAYQDLVKVHDTVTLYMATLATLAGDKVFDLSQGIESVTGQIKAHPDFGVDAKHVDAISNLAKLAVKWTLSAYQQDAVEDMIRAGEAPMQASLEGMSNLLRIYRKTHANERKQVIGLFETEFALAEVQPKDPLLMALARLHHREKLAEYDAVDLKFDAAEKAVSIVAAGHTQLYRGVDALTAAELKVALSALTKDLKAIRMHLRELQ